MSSLKLATLALVAGTIGSAPALAHDPVKGPRNMDHEIGMCVAEVGKQANYDEAQRVVHKVVDIEQKNLAEQRIRIETQVYTVDGESWSREYASRCVTRGALKVVSFEIEETSSPTYSAAL